MAIATPSKVKRSSALTASGKKYSSQSKSKFSLRQRQVIPRLYFGLGFPERALMRHTYCEKFTILNGAAALGQYDFSANGMYDPNITGTGHQPVYFDQMAALYNHYTVISSKITVIWIAPGPVTQPISCTVFQNDDTTLVSTTNMSANLEQTNAISVPSVIGVGSTGTVTQTAWYSAKRTWGPGFLQNSALSATTGSNPAEGSYFTLVYEVNGGVASSMIASVTIEYLAEWRELKDIAQS